jgi:hypothetical protein
MPRQFEHPLREPDFMRWPDVPSFYWVAMGTAILCGLVGGALWIAWKLFELHVLR